MKLINNMAEAFLALNAERKVILFNPAAARMLQTKNIQGQVLRDVMRVVNKDNQPVDLSVLIAAKSTEVITRNDFKIIRDDQTSVALDFSISPIDPGASGNNEITHIVVIRDVTERKNLDEQREEFVSVISHELRTPIATAEADLAILLNPKITQLNEQSLHYVQVAHDQVVYLSNIVNDISSIARLDKESFQTKPEPLHAAKLAEALRDEYTEQMSAKGLLFRVVIPDDLPTVITNPHEVKEILDNLLGNAIKYSPQGTITLSVDNNYRGEPGVLYAVEDRGIGIAKADLSHVFEKFWRSEDYRTRQSGGTGLGLYLCARLADRLKAQLWAESELGRGSKFYLFLPQQNEKPQNIKQLLAS
jgi:PAS domain S-box-containing protein